MRLEFIRPYASINSLESIELPKFTLITGINGSGKTHLLKSIEGGHVLTDVASANRSDIRFFTWSSLAPNGSVQADANTLLSERAGFLRAFRDRISKLEQSVIQIAQQQGLPPDLLTSPREIARLSIEDLQYYLISPQQAEAAHSAIQQAMKNVSNRAMHEFRSNENAKRFFCNLESFLGMPIGAATEDEIDSFPLEFGTTDVFRQSFANLFISYRHAYQKNSIKRDAFNDGYSSSPPLSKEEFERKYGGPPWEFVNDTLASASLDFRIDSPSMHGTGPYFPKLTKKDGGSEIRFENLSSGEKVLMSLAFCIYYTKDRRQSVSYPKLLLFDEIDAPLHPSRAKLLIETITDVLVSKHHINVILTTHSPSTVALAPPESIYAMQFERPRLKKVTQRHAISLLTSEIPALSISFHGKRQVFVEDKSDAGRYHQLFGDLHPYLRSNGRFLQFIGVGRKNREEQTEGSGCSKVYDMVSSLANAGNETVFGLVDWDKSNNPTDRVFVLAHGIRYSIENCLLDPLLILAALIREDRSVAKNFGLNINSHIELANLSAEDIQRAIDIIQDIFPQDKSKSIKRLKVHYRSGIALNISQAYLHCQGHALEMKIKETYPKLRRHHKNGQLLLHIIKDVLPDHDGFIPMDLINSFQNILDAEII